MTECHVVMSNDFADCVFSEKWKAEIYVEMQDAWQKELLKSCQSGSRIRYYINSFKIDSPGCRATRRDSHHNQISPTLKDQEEFRASLRARWDERREASGPST